MMRTFISVIVCLLCLMLPVRAEEVITNFKSEITVNRDASLDVVELISVLSEGVDIRHGIFRDFPTRYLDKHGNPVQVEFTLKTVLRDGVDEKYTVESIQNGTRVKMGDKDVFLPHGLHQYQISYRTTRQLGFFENFDELYWNVTGNGWLFAIQNASVKLQLPQGAEISAVSLYTGYAGAKGLDAETKTQSGGTFAAATIRTLQPREGFTVAVDWQKGIVLAPSDAQRRLWMLRDNGGFLAVGLTLLSVAGYFFYAWFKVGRDPPQGTIIPLFHPPENMGPAGVRYVWKQGSDDRAVAAALVGLAVKGRLKIENSEDVYTLHKTSGGAALLASEAALYNALPNDKLILKQSNNAEIRAAMAAATQSLATEYNGKLFVKNYNWFVVGLALSLLGVFASAWLMPDGQGVVWLFVGGIVAAIWSVILVTGWAVIKGLISGRGFLTKLKSLIALVFLAPFFAAGLAGPVLAIMNEVISPALIAMIAATVALGLLNVLFYVILPAPTAPGRVVLDAIAGFRLYMTTAEEKRLDMLNAPEKTPALFERYLPYAMALDCENAWNDKFSNVLAAAALAGASAPLWYYGSSNRGWGGLSEGLGAGLASTLSSASTAPGSSSGSGGGGSSGGGGGGGGGGGW